jgi:hypothetical protein
MYNNGLLNSFGLVLAQGPATDLSQGWEHPPASVFSLFFDENYLPTCTVNQNVSAMHFTFNHFWSLRC